MSVISCKQPDESFNALNIAFPITHQTSLSKYYENVRKGSLDFDKLKELVTDDEVLNDQLASKIIEHLNTIAFYATKEVPEVFVMPKKNHISLYVAFNQVLLNSGTVNADKAMTVSEFQSTANMNARFKYKMNVEYPDWFIKQFQQLLVDYSYVKLLRYVYKDHKTHYFVGETPP